MNEHDRQAEICRVCRSEGTPEQPLFYPCLCSGSIKYIHQDCLVEWLKHSKKKYCELCKHPFTFSPVYAEQMPQKIPIKVLLVGLVKKAFSGFRIGMSLSFATILWFLAVPLITSQIFHYYFGWNLHGLLMAAFPIEDLKNDPLLETSMNICFDVVQGFLLTGFTVFFLLGMMLVREFISMMRRTIPAVEHPREIEQRAETDSASIASGFTGMATNTQDTISNTNPLDTLGHIPLSPLSPRPNLLASPVRRHSELHRGSGPLSPSSESTTNNNFWTDRVHPKEYRNYVHRRELHAQMSSAEESRSFAIEGPNPESEDDQLLLPDDHISNISGTTTLRSRFTARTDASSTTTTASANSSYRCRICSSNTCIIRDHVIQASQIRNNITAQRHQSLLERVEMNASVAVVNDQVTLPVAPLVPAPAPAPAPAPPTFEADANDDLFGWNLDAAENISLPEFFGFTFEGTALLELLQNAAIVIGCNTLVMHMFLFIPFITGKVCSDGSLFNALTAAIQMISKLILKPETINTISHFIQYKIIASEFLFALSFNEYIKLISFGNSFICNVILGYSVLCSLLSLYAGIVRNLKDSFHRNFIPAISFVGTFIKLISLMFIEMFLFPLVCGFMVDYACLSIFSGLTFLERLQSVRIIPISSLTIHWAIGAGFMISFSSLVSFFRSFLRPGLLFFLRNPQDPENHPIKEMVERGFIDQVYRIGISFIFYGIIIASTVGLGVKCFTGIPLISLTLFPFKLKYDNILLDVPIDLFLQLMLRQFWIFLSLSKSFKKVCIYVSKRFIRALNLSSYFIGGGRYLSEESFPAGGQWVSVPDYDKLYTRERLKEIRSRKVTPFEISKLKIISDKQGQPVLESRSTTTAASSPSPSDFTVVFRPNYFKLRCFIALIGLILSIQILLLSLMALPLFTGKYLIGLLIDSENVHVRDIYSWFSGSIVLLLSLKIIDLLILNPKSLRRGSELAGLGLLSKLSFGIGGILKSLIILIFVMFLWPLQIGIILTLIINPIIYSEINIFGSSIYTPPSSSSSIVATNQIIFFGACWSLGIPFLRVIFYLRNHLPLSRNSIQFSSNFNHLNFNFHDINLLDFFKFLVIPFTSLLTGFLLLPPLSCLLLLAPLNSSNYNEIILKSQYSSHLIAISAFVILKLIKYACKTFINIIAGIRDETYLIGRRLHNLDGRRRRANRRSRSESSGRSSSSESSRSTSANSVRVDTDIVDAASTITSNTNTITRTSHRISHTSPLIQQ